MINVEGIVLPNTPLSNLEINEAAKQLGIPHFKGCVCRDELTGIPSEKECGILNLDKSDGNGTHWVCWYKDKDLKIYFVSYGLQPPVEMIKYLRRGLQYNTHCVQPRNTVVCGHLCLFVLKRLSMGKSFQQILNNLL